MSFKNLTYALLGIIFFLLILLSFSYFNKQNNHQFKETSIHKIISDFGTKFHNDSIVLVKNNKIYLDKISQNIKDSIVNIYEKKLKLAFKNNKLELLSNNFGPMQEDDFINIAMNSNINIASKTPVLKYSSNVTSYSKLDNYVSTPNYSESTNYSSNVTSYTKLNNYKKPVTENKTSKFTSNVTLYSKLEKTNLSATKNTSNVTSYSKLEKATKKIKVPKKVNNVTSYSKLKNSSKNNYVNKPKKQIALNNYIKKSSNNLYVNKQNSNLVYSNAILNNSINFNDIKVSPIYSGCENKYSERDKKNCFATKLSNHVDRDFNTKDFNKSNLKKGYNNIRVLLIIDNIGNSSVGKIVGHWPQNVKKEVNRVIRSIPKMTPGKYQNNNISVKYSFKIPFLIK